MQPPRCQNKHRFVEAYQPSAGWENVILYGEYTLNRSLIQIRGGFAYLLAYISARICTVPLIGGF